MAEFKAGRAAILIATDVAARGLGKVFAAKVGYVAKQGLNS